MSKQYQHSQIGYLIVAALTFSMLFLAYMMVASGLQPMALAVMVLLGVSLAIFHRLTTTIDDDNLEVRFGTGLVGWKFPLKDIQTFEVVRSPWYGGWGIHPTAQGVLFNVSGTQAVKITMENGRRYLIGTDKPNELADAIRRATERVRP